MRSGVPQEQLNNRVSRQYTFYATGDGVKTEFPLGKNIIRLDDLTVTVSGLDMRVSDKGIANDYKVRGLTPGYAGDANFVKFTAAPAGAAKIRFVINAT